MKKWKEYYKSDLHRYNGVIDVRTKHLLKYFRKCQFGSGLLLFLSRIFFRRIKRKLSIELFGKTKVGKGLYIGHPFGITINDEVVIGNNCNIHRGVLIGKENRGDRKGVPTIGNDVWIGINASIVGAVSIGNDVLIAPNSFVNRNIPDHSIVFGNPCIVKHKDRATLDYVNNRYVQNVIKEK